MTPQVSVIVATHNRPDFLLRCLLAIHRQTFENFECIVVGDNCDYSEAVVKIIQEKDKRFKYYKFVGERPTNEGAVAKNIGLSLAKGQFIAYCDDDNILLQNHIQVLMALWIGSVGEIWSRNIKDGYVRSAYSHCDHGESFEGLLNEDLYYGTVNVAGYNDALTMLHENKEKRWTEKEKLDTHEDTDFLRQFSLVGEISVVTAIYHQHHAGKTKDGEYEHEVLMADGFVYPNRAMRLCEKYL